MEYLFSSNGIISNSLFSYCFQLSNILLAKDKTLFLSYPSILITELYQSKIDTFISLLINTFLS